MSNEAPRWTPGRMLATSSNYWQACAIHAAVKLEIFTALGEESLSGAALATKTDTDPRATEMLLNSLTALGLLIKSNGAYANTPFSSDHLVKTAPNYLGYIVMHHHHLVDAWAQLDQAVQNGRPVAKRDHGEERERESFLMGMFNLALAIAPEIAASIDLSDRKRLLDLGGGPGTHAIHFCLANPQLSATIFDRPTTRPFAEQTVQRFGVAERIDFIGGDFLVDPLPADHDVVWISQILHSCSEEQCRALLTKSIAALHPGGLILIHDFFLDDTMAGPLFPALFSLNMLLNNQGRSYGEKEVRQMLAESGISGIECLPFRAPNDSTILVGRKPC